MREGSRVGLCVNVVILAFNSLAAPPITAGCNTDEPSPAPRADEFSHARREAAVPIVPTSIDGVIGLETLERLKETEKDFPTLVGLYRQVIKTIDISGEAIPWIDEDDPDNRNEGYVSKVHGWVEDVVQNPDSYTYAERELAVKLALKLEAEGITAQPLGNDPEDRNPLVDRAIVILREYPPQDIRTLIQSRFAHHKAAAGSSECRLKERFNLLPWDKNEQERKIVQNDWRQIFKALSIDVGEQDPRFFYSQARQSEVYKGQAVTDCIFPNRVWEVTEVPSETIRFTRSDDDSPVFIDFAPTVLADLLRTGKLDAILSDVGAREVSKPQRETRTRSFDLSKDSTAYITVIPKSFDATLAAALPQAILLEGALQNKYGAYCTSSLIRHDEPLSTLEQTLDTLCLGDSPPRDVFIQVVSHGDQDGLLFPGESSGPQTLEYRDLYNLQGKYKKTQLVFYITGCMGGGLIEQAKILLASEDPLAFKPSPVVLTQNGSFCLNWGSDLYGAAHPLAVTMCLTDPDITLGAAFNAADEVCQRLKILDATDSFKDLPE